MFDYFETDDAVYSIYNGKHMKHMKVWDNIPGFQYFNMEIPLKEYVRAYRRRSDL